MKKITYIFTLMFLIISVKAQSEQVSITRAELACDKSGKQVLNVMFDKSLRAAKLNFNKFCNSKPDDPQKPNDNPRANCFKSVNGWLDGIQKTENFYVIKLSDGKKHELTLLKPILLPDNDNNFPNGNGDNLPLQNEVQFSINPKLIITDAPFKLISKITKLADGSQKPNASMVDIAIMDSCNAVADKLPKPTKPPEEEKSEKKFSDYVKKPADETSPVLKMKLSLDGSSRFKKVDGERKRRFFTVEADIRPVRYHRLGLGGSFNITPFFLKTEWGGTEKKNTLNIGTEINHLKIFRDDGSPLSFGNKPQKYFIGFNTIITPKIETEWGFKEVSFVQDFKERLPINVYMSRKTSITFNPYIGYEVGYRIKSKKSQKGWEINRGYVGADMYLGFLRKDDMHRFVIESEYTRRMLLHPELSYDLDEDGKEIPDRESRRVREYFKTKFTLNLGLISPYLQYEYGRQAPKWILINNHYTTGLDVNLDFFWKKNR